MMGTWWHVSSAGSEIAKFVAAHSRSVQEDTLERETGSHLYF